MAEKAKVPAKKRVAPEIGKIEKGVPIPTTRSAYPWPEMELGDSIVVPRSAGSSARGWVKKHRPGWKVVEHQEGPAEGGRIRVWFVADGRTEPGGDFPAVDGREPVGDEDSEL